MILREALPEQFLLNNSCGSAVQLDEEAAVSLAALKPQDAIRQEGAVIWPLVKRIEGCRLGAR